jgi:hypothetical protein
MRLFLREGSAHLQILSRSHLREFRDIGSAQDFLRLLLADMKNIAAAQREMGPEEDLVERLAQRIVSEGLQIVRCSDGYFPAPAIPATAQQQATPLQDQQAAQQQAAATTDHFIEIELVDEDGNPVANAAYVIELPDGTQKTGRTDGAGKARITGIDPGTAKVSFPGFDKTAYVADSRGGGS